MYLYVNNNESIIVSLLKNIEINTLIKISSTRFPRCYYLYCFLVFPLCKLAKDVFNRHIYYNVRVSGEKAHFYLEPPYRFRSTAHCLQPTIYCGYSTECTCRDPAIRYE